MKGRRTGNLKIAKTPRKKKADKKKPGLVSECDHCGKPFGRTKAGMTYARTVNSAGVLAPSNGLFSACRNGRWMVFCNEECRWSTASKPCAAIVAMS